jgi:hypothetical protein
VTAERLYLEFLGMGEGPREDMLELKEDNFLHMRAWPIQVKIKCF